METNLRQVRRKRMVNGLIRETKGRLSLGGNGTTNGWKERWEGWRKGWEGRRKTEKVGGRAGKGGKRLGR